MVKSDMYEPEQLRKLFIGGLDYRTTDDSLKAYFEKYGEIVDVVVMKDPKTKRSRGFGFVAFSKPSMVDEAQRDRPHKIDGRSVDTKRAVPRDEIGKPESGARVHRLFVGGLKDSVVEEDLIEAFQEFGEIKNVSIPTEKGTNKKRGFAFVEFDDYDPVDKACLFKNIEVKNKIVNVKKALSRDEMSQQKRSDRSGGNQPWGNSGSGGSWGNNSGGWGDDRSWGNQSSFNSGQSGGSGNYGGFGNRSWQSSGPPQVWNNQGSQGWGSSGNYNGSGNWGQRSGGSNSNFGNYNQSFGGGPMRNQGMNNRPAPYNTGSGGYGSGGYGGGGGMGGGLSGMRRF